jgi:hypothetical protein
MNEASAYPDTPLNLDERFWSKVDIRSPGECWEFIGCRTPSGYGRFSLDGKVVNANRLVVGLRVGDEGWALHHCDNPPCVNPAHLYIGSPADNRNDAVVRGRLCTVRGGRAGRSVEEALIVKIRTMYALGHMPTRIAKNLNRNVGWVAHVVKGRRWADGPWPVVDESTECLPDWHVFDGPTCIKCGKTERATT